MQRLGFRSVFAKLFASVMLALILFAVAMVLLTQLVQDKDATIRSNVLATQIMGQIDPFLHDLNLAISNDNRLQARFMLAVIKKSFDIFDESLQAKMGIYDNEGHLLMQTDNSDLPLQLPATPSLMTRMFPSLSDQPSTEQAQVYSSTGYTLLYESRLSPKKPALSAVLNLFTGTLLLLLIMAGVLWLIARTMTWRINQMSQQMSQLGDGDFSVRVNARGNDEIAYLAKGFNQAAQKIEQLINANNLLLAHASHELRTPITRIRLQIEMMDMLAASLPDTTKAKFDKRAQAINRDLSGLNDLVESILLVSRLDAGHVMQQVERLDLYDLVNQERQHYPEATLIGEHIVIDGQPAMLTHLIRNLLNNAVLHGVPPVTVFLYGVQDSAEADELPDYILQSVMDSGFAEQNSLAYDEYQTTLAEETRTAETELDDYMTPEPNNKAVIEVDKDQNMLPPAIYRNGETLVLDNADDGHRVPAFEKAPALHSIQRHDAGLISNARNLSAELIYNIKKVTWHALPDAQSNDEPTQTNAMTQAADTITDKNPDKENKTEALVTPKKESLFKKHLNKSKIEPTRPSPKYAVLAVIDEGNGIPEDKREDIFSPFVRLQQKNKGSGLGLSLVSQIVNAHQGHISTDTINGHTRFLVVLPVIHDPNYHEQDN